MKNLTRINYLLFTVGMLLTLLSCQQDIEDQPKPIQKLSIENDVALLDVRIDNTMQYVDVIGEDLARVSGDFSLVQVSQVSAPVKEGLVLTASAIDIKDKYIAVGYNYPGPDFYGAVELLKREGEALTFLTSISLNQTDVSMINYENNDLYWVGGSPTRDSVALMERITLKNNEPDEDSYVSVRLGGHLSTCIQKAGDNLFVTTGNTSENGGGLHTLDRKSFERTDYQLIEDARWVEVAGNYLVVLGATPGQLYVYNRSPFELLRTIDVSGLIYDGTKATFDVYSKHIYVASAYEGVNIYSLETGELKANVPLPEDQYSPEMMTLSVTMEGNKGFMACGEAVFMFKVNSAGTNPTPYVIGRLDLGDYQSINYVRYRSGYLYIAAGSGGAKLIKVSN